MRRGIAALLLLCAGGLGQQRHEIQLLAGFSPASTAWIGTARDRRFALAGFAYSYRGWERGTVSIAYKAALFPAAVLLQPAGRGAVYGFAMAPVGVNFEFGRGRVRPFVESLGGVIASTEPIPERLPNATGLNFLVDVGGGIRWKAVSVGYRLMHISNAGTTAFNPGVDNNVVYAGYTFKK
jgi:hypothetical protein